jgi:hypothetical protein
MSLIFIKDVATVKCSDVDITPYKTLIYRIFATDLPIEKLSIYAKFYNFFNKINFYFQFFIFIGHIHLYNMILYDFFKFGKNYSFCYDILK